MIKVEEYSRTIKPSKIMQISIHKRRVTIEREKINTRTMIVVSREYHNVTDNSLARLKRVLNRSGFDKFHFYGRAVWCDQ